MINMVSPAGFKGSSALGRGSALGLGKLGGWPIRRQGCPESGHQACRSGASPHRPHLYVNMPLVGYAGVSPAVACYFEKHFGLPG